MKVAVAGTGYVGLSLAVLLSQHNDVTAVDIQPEKVELINQGKSPIRDEYIEKFLAERRRMVRRRIVRRSWSLSRRRRIMTARRISSIRQLLSRSSAW